MPLAWYKDEDHIGYDLKGKKIIRKQRMDALDRLLDRNDSKKVTRGTWETGRTDACIEHPHIC